MPVSTVILLQAAFFDQCPPGVLAFAASRMELIELRKREVLQPHGQPFDGLGLVVQGSVQAVGLTLDAREVAVQTAQAGDVLGLEELLAPRRDPATWVASTAPATVAVLPRSDALQLLEMDTMALRAARWLAQALSDEKTWHRLLGVHPVLARVCACLLRLMQPDGTLRLPTHAELGWRLNTTRESVTRTLQRLQQDGVVQRRSEGWVVVDEAALRRLARPEG